MWYMLPRVPKPSRTTSNPSHADYSKACDVLGNTWDREVREGHRRYLKQRRKAAWDRFTGADSLNR